MTIVGAQIASNSLLPPDVGGQFNQASWKAGAADALANGIIQQAIANNGDTSSIGFPSSWPYGSVPAGAVRADGTISPLLWSQIQGYVNSSAAQNDPDFGNWLGVQYSQAAPGGVISQPLTAAEQLARDQFEFNKTQSILKLIGGSQGSTSSGSTVRSSSASRSSSGGSGGGSSGKSLEQQQAEDAQSLATYQAKRDIDLAYQQALNALQNDPNNPELAYKAAQLAETRRQFDEQMVYQRDRDAKSLGLDTAKIIADYSANPGDAVAREYFLRGQAQPVGNAVNIFSGQPTGQQMTFSQMMQANAPLVGQALNSSLTGQPVEAQQNAQASPSAQREQQVDTSPPEPPADDRTPQYARGTARGREITPDGWTRAKQFIAGDPQIPGVENPEHIRLRVRNGEPEAKVTPLSKVLRGRGRMHMYADGTDPWAWQGTDWNQADNLDAFGNVSTDFGSIYNPHNLAQPQSGAYLPSSATSPVYNSSTGGSNITLGSSADPYAVQGNSGVPYNVSMAAADPFFGTAYQGMDPNAVVTNANNPYYGMTAQAAFDSQATHNAALTAYNPASLDSLGQVTGAAPAYLVGPSADIPGLYDANGNPRDTINVANQADAGILTGAQMSGGVTQSANPGLPGYVRPADLPPLPGNDQMGVTTSTDTPTGGTQTDSVKPVTTAASEAQPNLANDQVQNGQPVQDGLTAPTTTGVNLGSADAGGNQLVMGQGTYTKDGATWDLLPGDYRRPDGTWVRYDAMRKEYLPIQPNYTPITSEDQFWKLPPDVQQKILTGQPTGYALLGPWRSGLLAGLQSQLGGNGPGPMSDTEVQSLPLDQVINLLDNPPQQMGSYQPGQYLTRQDLGPTMGTSDGLIRLPMGGPTSSPIDYSQSLSQAQIDAIANMTPQETYNPNPGTIMKPWDELTTAIEEKPGPGWQIYKQGPQIDTPTTIAIAPDGTTYMARNGIWNRSVNWHNLSGTDTPLTSPDQLASWLASNGYAHDSSYAQAATGTTTGATGSTGTTTTGATGTVDAAGGTTSGATAGSTAGSTAETTTGGSTGGTTGGSAQGNALAQALAQLLGISYGSDAYQNLPALLFAGGGDSGNYDTVSNQPIEVPGLGISLPSASQMMNYEMLNKLQQNGSFDLLNSLYTAGNVPLSILLKMAEARAPRGSAYEPGLVSTV